jgi:hypothetical protein
MIIYRVQDSEGRGPWRPGFSDKWVEDRDDYGALPPWPIEFPGLHAELTASLVMGKHVGCGCVSLEQLRRWFRPTEIRTLKRYGYHAVQMQVSRILAASDSQCVFERMVPLRDGIEAVELYPN